MQEYTKHKYCSMNFRYFLLGVSASIYILKPCQEIGQSFEESLRGKHVDLNEK